MSQGTQQGLCINLEGWGGEGDRREVQKGGGSDSKGSVYNAGDSGSSPGLGRSLEKEMAIHSSTIAWKIQWTEEPGRLQSMGSQRVGHD